MEQVRSTRSPVAAVMSAQATVLLIFANFLLLSACSVLPQRSAPSPADVAGPTFVVVETKPVPASPTTPAPTPKATQRPSAGAQDAQSRIGNSANLTLAVEKKVLPSYHLEVTGSEPSWNKGSKKVENRTFTLKGDLSGDDIHMVYVSSSGGKTTSTEGYSIKGGLTNKEQGGKEYIVAGGKVKESIGAVSLTWAFLPLSVAIPLVVAATGPTALGEEAIDGRPAEKYSVDSAKAPAGVVGAMGGIITISSAKGTAWVDKETGALLKMVLDYEQNLIDPPGSGTVVGKGSGHIELSVTKVGKVTVTLPK